MSLLIQNQVLLKKHCIPDPARVTSMGVERNCAFNTIPEYKLHF